MRSCLLVLLLALLTISLFGIEVGGHITQSTTWSPENGPYVITSYLYIDSDVTLTILPGTRIRCMGADKSNIYNFMWSGTGVNPPLAKKIIVHGKIIAHGTDEQPISFDKYQEGENYRWGGIYMSPSAAESSFEHCVFRNSFFGEYEPGEWSLGAIEFSNGILNVRSCTFENNLIAVRSGYLRTDILFYNCIFISINDDYPVPFASTGFFGFSAAPTPVPERNYKVTVAKCSFTGSASLGPVGYHMDVLYLHNTAVNFQARDADNHQDRNDYGSTSSYGNTGLSGTKGWGSYSATPSDTVFNRRNRLIKPELGIPLLLSASGYGTNYISDNYLSGSVQVKTGMSNATQSHFYNNIIEKIDPYSALLFDDGSPNDVGGQVRFYNNLVGYLGDIPTYVVTVRSNNPDLYNNTILNYDTLLSSNGDFHTTFTNNIIDISFNYGYFGTGDYPILLNNCLSIPIPPQSPIFGENNIVADPVFADTLAGDYSLGEGSPCIDAGVNRPDLPDFDLRYHKRIMPGAPGVPNQVDIGAYEYNSVYIGGINGYVYDSVSGVAVDCVKIKIQGKLPEFSDSLGAFSYPSGAGLYTVKASRWDYHDLIIPNVQVNLGEETLLSIPLTRTNVQSEDETQSPVASFGLGNSPNPFNPETRLSFILPQSGRVQLDIYNLRGQLVRRLLDTDKQAGHHKLLWDGRDEAGRTVGSGIYFARVQQGSRSQVHKMMLVK